MLKFYKNDVQYVYKLFYKEVYVYMNKLNRYEHWV